MPTRIVSEVKRGCGYRKEGGVYMIGGGEKSENGVLPMFTEINPPIPYSVQLHRSFRLVNAQAVLSRSPMDSWWIGASKDTEQKKNADAWAINTFGMTITKRLETGDCADAKDADEALAILVSKIKLDPNDNRLYSYFQQLSRSRIQELPRVAEHYASLHEHLVKYANTKNLGSLVGAQAALWRTAYTIQPSKRPTYVPYLVRFLMLMNLTKDALAMKRIFL